MNVLSSRSVDQSGSLSSLVPNRNSLFESFCSISMSKLQRNNTPRCPLINISRLSVNSQESSLVPDSLLCVGYTADKMLSPWGSQLFGLRTARLALMDLSDYLRHVGCTVGIQFNRNVDNL